MGRGHGEEKLTGTKGRTERKLHEQAINNDTHGGFLASFDHQRQ
jgi:hypothetical protein